MSANRWQEWYERHEAALDAAAEARRTAEYDDIVVIDLTADTRAQR